MKLSNEFYEYSLLSLMGININDHKEFLQSFDWQRMQQSYGETIDQVINIMNKGALEDDDNFQLSSPFTFVEELRDHELDQRSTNIYPRKLSLLHSYLFPGSEEELEGGSLLESFLLKLKKTNLDHNNNTYNNQILPLMEQYLATTRSPVPGIPLYDYSRIGTAMASCIENNRISRHPSPKDALFVKGDFSGIQPFIFDVNSRGAARSLKGRSFRVQAISELAIHKIMDSLELCPANLIYNGGGNFFFLIPVSNKSGLEQVSKEINQYLLKHSNGLTLFMGSIPVELEDFNQWHELWGKVDSAVNISRLQPYFQLDELELFQHLDEISLSRFREAQSDFYKDVSYKLNQAHGFRFLPANEDHNNHEFSLGKLEMILSNKEEEVETLILDSQEKIEKLEIFPGKAFRYFVKRMPVWEDDEQLQLMKERFSSSDLDLEGELSEEQEDLQPGNIKSFESLAFFAGIRTGSAKIGVLKLDMDNLGRFIRERLGKGKRSLGHAAYLSRSLNWFFEGYMNELLDTPVKKVLENGYNPDLISFYLEKIGENERFRDHLYVLFSGGDDLFIVGGWDFVLEFACLVKNEFDEFTLGELSISGGMVVVNPKFPVSRFAQLAEEAVEKAKNVEPETKARFCLFGKVLKWEDVSKAIDLRNELFHLRTRPKGELNSFISDVKWVGGELEKISDGLMNGIRVSIPRLGRWVYALSNVKKENFDTVENILIKPIELMTQKMLNRQKYDNPAFISVGARLAEFMLRNNLKQKNHGR